MSKAPGKIVGVRIPVQLRARIDQAVRVGPYRLTVSNILVRGITLALEELEAMRKAAKGGKQ